MSHFVARCRQSAHVKSASALPGVIALECQLIVVAAHGDAAYTPHQPHRLRMHGLGPFHLHLDTYCKSTPSGGHLDMGAGARDAAQEKQLVPQCVPAPC